MALPRPQQPDKVLNQDPAGVLATPTTSDKLSELRQYRHAQGLCDCCAEKWFRGHKCPPTIQLHAMQELRDLLALDEFQESPEEEQAEQILLALSHDAQMGSHSVRTIQFQGTVYGKPVVVLVDSGSSSSFLAASIVA